ncbi:MAG: UDP-N-acetylmuramate dehydrogenase [Alphaproteobacteria bacterium]
MGKEWPVPAWLEKLPVVAGGYQRNVSLAEFTTIQVGGPAEVLVEPADWAEVKALVAVCGREGIPLTVVGKGSNMVVRDGGIGGVVVHVDKGCDVVELGRLRQGSGEPSSCSLREGEGFIYAEAGADSGKAARVARDAGFTGLEFLGGIPGSIGGALRMNAGAYGHETFDDLVEVWVIDETGVEREVEPASLKPRYRGIELPAGWVLVAGVWQLRVGDKAAIKERMREINTNRRTSQPLHMPSSGSWFKNVVLPRDIEGLGKAGEKVNAWRVVDAAGCRGWREGGAQVSEQHCNFFVNTGGATCADLDRLSHRVEDEVLGKLGVVMEREVRFVGVELTRLR